MGAGILVVDDAKLERFFLCKLLERIGIQADEAADGETALAMARDTDYKLLLIDERMPGPDGWETAERIRREKPAQPIVMLGEKNENAGDSMFVLKKPVEYRRLTEVMQTYLALPPVKKEPQQAAGGLDTAQGIKNCGSKEGYQEALSVYYRTLSDKAYEIEGYVRSEDIASYTIKVHALKSSSRIIGANALADWAERLEAAGNAGDWESILAQTDGLLADYRRLKEIIAPMLPQEAAEDDKEPVPQDMLSDAYMSFPEFIEQMDVDLMEMVLDSLDGYRLPPEDERIIRGIRERLLYLDWDGMGELLSERNGSS